VLEIIDLCAAYGETGVLHGISLTVDPGQITAIIGANGAGKSTMLKCVTGLLKPSRGRILWEGRDLSKVSTAGIVSLGVTMVPEGRHIFPQMTVAENLDMGAYLRHDKDGIKEDRAWVIELFPSLHSRLRQQAGTLSGGEQQMLAVGRALMSAPKLLLMDEPSMGLAPVIVEEVFRAIGRIRQMGKTVLLVEQNAVLTLTIADKGYVLELGNIVLTGTGQELLHNPKVEKAYLGV